MPTLPPLDLHAHIATDLSARDLEGLGAVVFAATRSLNEFMDVATRGDRVTVWGVGCHPSLVGVQRAFDPERFARALAQTPFVSEIGLDGTSRVPITTQRATLHAILTLLAATPRIASVHSRQACAEVLEELAAVTTHKGIVLHWWLGSPAETEWAIALGAYFSVNFSMVRGSDGWKQLPLNRVLLETDHPSGDRFSPRPRQPGRVQPVEQALARHHGVSETDIRIQTWRNLARLASEANVVSQLPAVVRAMLSSV